MSKWHLLIYGYVFKHSKSDMLLPLASLSCFCCSCSCICSCSWCVQPSKHIPTVSVCWPRQRDTHSPLTCTTEIHRENNRFSASEFPHKAAPHSEHTFILESRVSEHHVKQWFRAVVVWTIQNFRFKLRKSHNYIRSAKVRCFSWAEKWLQSSKSNQYTWWSVATHSSCLLQSIRSVSG